MSEGKLKKLKASVKRAQSTDIRIGEEDYFKGDGRVLSKKKYAKLYKYISLFECSRIKELVKSFKTNNK